MQILRLGSEGAVVKLLQTRLAAKGFLPGAADGSFGPKTDRAVRQFQAANHLKVDGIVGDKTWGLLLAGPTVDVAAVLIAEQRKQLIARVPATLAPGSRRAVLEAAVGTLGWREQPDGSNGGPDLDEISTGLPGWDYGQGKPPWCALAVSYWLLKGLGASSYAAIPFGARFAAVSQIEGWAKSGGRVLPLSGLPPAEIGSVFTMSRSGSGSDLTEAVAAGHCGLVVADEGPFVLTVEGNTGNRVDSRRRRKSTLRVLVRWW